MFKIFSIKENRQVFQNLEGADKTPESSQKFTPETAVDAAEKSIEEILRKIIEGNATENPEFFLLRSPTEQDDIQRKGLEKVQDQIEKEFGVNLGLDFLAQNTIIFIAREINRQRIEGNLEL